MTLSFYNTLARARVPFVPHDPKRVTIYACGPTVYDYAHLGNARAAVVFDVLFRLLRHTYGAAQVVYARNYTDVDDKINAAAQASGNADIMAAIADITQRTTRYYEEDMAALLVLEPTLKPRVTDNIAAIIAMIETLLARGYAYVAEGHVLFATTKLADYGKLSRHSRDDLIAGARVDVAPYKADPADFVLWKPSPPELPGWDSPWGRGRPGWHIECSAMIAQHLGTTIDIHAGGHDLIFPHHENEIAQSESCHGAPLAQLWLHNGMLLVGGQKMSKSLGNFYTVRDVLAQAPGEAIRFYLLKTHYRQPFDLSLSGLKTARAELDKFYTALRDAPAVSDTLPPPELLAALGDDLNTPNAIRVLHDLCATIHKTKGEAKTQAQQALRAGGALLGIVQQPATTWFAQATDGVNSISVAEIEALIAARQTAKRGKNFAEADRLRAALLEQGVALEDTPQGTQWKRV